jgi:hypothetical protein
MNGLLRDYFPKGSDLSTVTVERVIEVAAELNDRPRKTLGWQRPASLFNAALIARLTPGRRRAGRGDSAVTSAYGLGAVTAPAPAQGTGKARALEHFYRVDVRLLTTGDARTATTSYLIASPGAQNYHARLHRNARNLAPTRRRPRRPRWTRGRCLPRPRYQRRPRESRTG